jgi:hypothetical protein
MSRNFEVLQRLERETGGSHSAPPAVAVMEEPILAAPLFVPPQPIESATPQNVTERLAREEETKLVHNLFLKPGSARNRVVVFIGAEAAVGCSETCMRAAEALAPRVTGKVCVVRASSDPIQRKPAGRESAKCIGPNLWIFTARTSTTKQAVGSNSAIAQQLLSLREQFEYLLIDSPAVRHDGESSVLAQAADGVVLVIKAGQTRREVVQRALDLLRAGNAQIAGMVLNQRTFPVPQALYERL